MELDIDEKEMDYVKHENERDHHWRVVFEGINGGVDYKVLLHAKRWDVYITPLLHHHPHQVFAPPPPLPCTSAVCVVG